MASAHRRICPWSKRCAPWRKEWRAQRLQLGCTQSRQGAPWESTRSRRGTWTRKLVTARSPEHSLHSTIDIGSSSIKQSLDSLTLFILKPHNSIKIFINHRYEKSGTLSSTLWILKPLKIKIILNQKYFFKLLRFSDKAVTIYEVWYFYKTSNLNYFSL